MIACICGGTIETWLFLLGLGFLCKFFSKFLKRKHDKENCDCCKESEKQRKEQYKDISEL
jgi:hypothetical protein